MAKPGEIVFDGIALHRIAKQAKWDEMLAQATADPSSLMVRNQFHATPFHYAVRYGAPTLIVLELIQLAPRVLYMKTDEGELPIHTAAQFGVSVTTMLAMLKQEPRLVERTNKDGETPLDIAQKAKVWPVGVLWHFYRDDYTRVCAIMENPAAREAMWEAQRSVGHEPVSIAEPMGKDVWADAPDNSVERREDIRNSLAKMDLPDVYVAVPLDPNLRAAVSGH